MSLSLDALAVPVGSGRANGPNKVELLMMGQEKEHFTTPSISIINEHGTGRTLSSIIAAGSAKGLPTRIAISEVKACRIAEITAPGGS